MKVTNICVFVFLFMATEEVIGDCWSPLGMESRAIRDSQISTSSTMSDLTKPAAGRLNNKISASLHSFGAWCASTTDSNQYFQVDLSSVNNITAVATQGTEIAGGQWVTEYTVTYSCDGRVFHPHIVQGSAVVFKGNNDSRTVVKNHLENPLPARFLRINPIAWNPLGTICLRVEVYGCMAGQGCPYPTLEANPTVVPTQSVTKSVTQSYTSRSNEVTQAPTTNQSTQDCSSALGMESGVINDSQISASSYLSTLTLSSASRLHHRRHAHKMSLGAWCARSSDRSPYLQVDLLRDTTVTAVGTQGMVETDSWVTQYMLSYSCDGKSWNVFGEDGKKKVFRGNRNSKHVTRNKLHVPLTARYIRIRPLTVSPFSEVCLRAELYGCVATNQAACSAGNISDVLSTADPITDVRRPTGTARGPQNTSSTTNRKGSVPKNTGREIIVIVKENPDVGHYSSSKAGKTRQRTDILGILALGLILRNML